MSNPFKSTALVLAALLSLTLACGPDDTSGETENNGSGANDGSLGSMTVDITRPENKSGPQSLSGFAWLFDPVTVNGLNLQLGFQFSQDMLTAQNTCNGSQSVTTSAPIKYLYNVEITEDAYQKEGEGENYCEVSISKGTFDFELDNGQLVVTADGMTMRFDASGQTSGLYGTWEFEGEDGFKLRWALGSGSIRAEADCTALNGYTAKTQASAVFKNYVEILMDAQNSVTDEFDNTCEVSISKGKIQYYFEGETLVMKDVASGEEVRLSP